MQKLLTLDIGTTAVKAVLFDDSLHMLSAVIQEYQLSTPKIGFVELSPQIYWDSAVAGIKRVMENTNSKPEDIIAITCTTQGETLIPVDENGQALHNAIVWLDSRANSESQTISKLVTPLEFYSRTGIPAVNGYCPVSKILWIKNNLPEVYEKTYCFLLLEDYLIFRLTGRFVTNPGVMCTTGYFDIVQNKVWSDLLEKCGLDGEKIPEVLPCATAVGTLSDEAVQSLGLSKQTIVTTGAMDQITGAIGAGNIHEGTVSETTGTAMVIAATTEHLSLESCSPVAVYTHAIPGRYLYIDVRQTAGIVLKWFRDEFCQEMQQEDSYRLMDELAEGVPPGSRGVLLYPHLTGVQVPILDERARGVFFGLGLDTGKGCLIRSILEGIGYALRESFTMMHLQPTQLVSMGGGSKSNLWNQIKADICDVPITIPEVSEAAALGAAVLGGVACGLFPDVETPVQKLIYVKQYMPNPENKTIYDNGYKKYCRMYQAFAPLFDGGQV